MGAGGGSIFVRNLSALQSFIYPYSNFPGSGRGNAKIKIDLESVAVSAVQQIFLFVVTSRNKKF